MPARRCRTQGTARRAVRRTIRRAGGEDGFALVSALLAVVVLVGLSLTFVAMAITEVRATGASRDQEHAVHVAEAGADRVIARVNAVYAYTTGHPWTTAAASDPRAWAIEQFEAGKAAGAASRMEAMVGFARTLGMAAAAAGS